MTKKNNNPTGMTKKNNNPTGKGGMKPGETRNPGGRPTLPDELRKRGPKCITFLLDMAEGKMTLADGRTIPAPAKHRLTAAIWCAERLFGKATQAVEVAGDGGFEEFMRRVLTSGGKIDLEKEAPPSAGAKK